MLHRAFAFTSLAVVFSLLLSACGSNAAPTATSIPPTATPSAGATKAPTGATPTVAAVSTPVQSAQTSYSAEKVKELLAEGFYLGGMRFGAGEEPKMGGTLTVSNRGDLPGADPMLSSGISSNNVLSALHGEGSLLRPKRSNIFDFEAHIAESWTSSDNFTVWTFKLRKDVKWHDGTGLGPRTSSGGSS